MDREMYVHVQQQNFISWNSVSLRHLLWQENPLLHLTYVDNKYHKNLAVLIKRGQEVLNKSSASDSENR